ncbi:hypothetical protein ACF1GT_18790 [Streptomyces sp. NPDC014636]|uniref:hypothetical protein n=1 Tax=Streptomyces sp. NPDC014636 TaxID=3364876 RepID=UPI0036FA6FF1
MRSARTLLATAAATAALAFATPAAAFAVPAEHDGGRDDSSYSKEDDSESGRDKGSDSDSDKDYGNKRDGGGEHDGPRGGMHTGGGALAAVSSGDWGSGEDDSRFDPESYRDKGSDGGGEDRSEKGGKGDKGDKGGKSEWDEEEEGRDKPRGGMHTGGGALAAPGVTAGGLAVLAVGATGVYALRRKKAAAPAS